MSSRQLTATIASGQGNSTAISIAGLPKGAGVLVPDAWTTADIAFEVSQDGETWYPLYDASGSEVVITGILTSQAAYYAAPPEVWMIAGWDYARLVSSNNQGADRELVLVLVS